MCYCKFRLFFWLCQLTVCERTYTFVLILYRSWIVTLSCLYILFYSFKTVIAPRGMIIDILFLFRVSVLICSMDAHYLLTMHCLKIIFLKSWLFSHNCNKVQEHKRSSVQRLFSVQCQKNFCAKSLTSLFSFLCSLVDFRDSGICLFDTSW